MVLETDLLDTLCAQVGCQYLSDLRYLQHWQRLWLARKVENIPVQAATLAEWNDALAYLAQGKAQPTSEQARTALIAGLRAK